MSFFYSNYDTPIIIREAQETNWIYFQMALDRFRTGFNAIAGNPWKEITNAAPTPTFLRPYASTIAPGTTSNNTATTNFISFYLSTDSGLLASAGNPVNGSETPHCRIFRVYTQSYRCELEFMDTRHANPSIDGNWCPLHDIQKSTASSSYDGPWTFLQDSLGGNSNGFPPATSSSSYVKLISCRIMVWDDLLYIAFNHDSEQTSGAMLYYPERVPGDLVTRNDYPLFFGISNNYNTTSYSSDHWWRPYFNALSPTSNEINYTYELGFLPQIADLQGREFVQRLHLYNTAQGAPWWSGMIPQIRVMRSGMGKGYHQVRGIGGIRHIQIKSLNSAIWLLREEDPYAEN